ncbi:hypothetical protein CEXT_134901 [Caerostris extrusa]|uniref:Uncharacterized protein n=1 Tax=Caerostris extrusa TaxID=172846 RepID=A0AAV4Q112_CAEEX|nr:hypothetical protein CEXT_134901 [Caerostris extrusa]
MNSLHRICVTAFSGPEFSADGKTISRKSEENEWYRNQRTIHSNDNLLKLRTSFIFRNTTIQISLNPEKNKKIHEDRMRNSTILRIFERKKKGKISFKSQ